MIKEDLRERLIKGRYSVNHVGVGATTPDRLWSTDPKRRASLNTYSLDAIIHNAPLPRKYFLVFAEGENRDLIFRFHHG